MNYLEQEVIAYSQVRAREILGNRNQNPAHDIEHVEMVVRHTNEICQGDQVDPFKPVVAAWLHDIGRAQEWVAKQEGRKVFHAEESAKQVPEILHPFREALGQVFINEVQLAVAQHSMPNSDDDTLTGVILKDADRLDGMGARGIQRTFNHAFDYRPFDLSDLFGTSTIPLREANQATMTQIKFPLYNIEWYGMLRSITAKKIAEVRLQRTITFLCWFANEVGGSIKELAAHKSIIAVRKIMPPEVFQAIDES